VVTSAMETNVVVCFTQRPCAFRFRELHCHAAVVVDEAARLSHQYGQRWTMASALTPKVPAQESVSPKTAQTHCLSNGK